MPFSAIGPDQNTKPQPVRVLLRNFKPVDEWIENPEPKPLSNEQIEEAEATAAQQEEDEDELSRRKAEQRQKRDERYANRRLQIASTLAVYGPTGKPRKRDDDGRPLEPSVRREWNSCRPDASFSEMCAQGWLGQQKTQPEWDEQRLANPIRAEIARKALKAEGCNTEEIAEAQAALDAYVFQPWKGCVYRGHVWIVNGTETAHWEPLSQPLCASTPILMGGASPNAVDAPTVDVWLTETVKVEKTQLTREEEQELRRNPPVPKKRVTPEVLNRIYEAYVCCPDEQEGNLHAAILAHATMRFANRCSKHMVPNTYQEPEDVLTDLVIHVMGLIRDGKYKHQGKLDHWLGAVWKNHFSGVRTVSYREAGISARLDLEEFLEADAKEDTTGKRGTVNSDIADWEESQRHNDNTNDPPWQVARLFAAMDDPQSKWSTVAPATKIMLRAMAKGANREEAAVAAGVSCRHGRRLFENLYEIVGTNPHMREELFRQAPVAEVSL